MSMKMCAIDQLMLERPGSSLPHEQLRGRLHQIEDTEKILRGLTDGNVAADSRDPDHVQLGRRQGEENGQRIINPWVRIDDHPSGRGFLHLVTCCASQITSDVAAHDTVRLITRLPSGGFGRILRQIAST